MSLGPGTPSLGLGLEHRVLTTSVLQVCCWCAGMRGVPGVAGATGPSPNEVSPTPPEGM